MAAKNRRKSRKDRLLPPTPEQLRQRREAAELAKLERQDAERRAQKTPEGFGINAEAMDLPQNATIERRTNARGKMTAAWRSNPFHCLVVAGTLEEDEGRAGYDLLAIYAVSKGLDGAPAWHSRLTQDDAEAWGKEDRKRYHIRLYAMIAASLTRASRDIAEALCYTFVEEDRPGSWGGIVQRACPSATTGPRQSTRMECLAEELLDVIPKARKELREIYDRKAA